MRHFEFEREQAIAFVEAAGAYLLDGEEKSRYQALRQIRVTLEACPVEKCAGTI